VSGAARHFFIYVVHSSLGAVGYVAALELSSWGGRARNHGTRGSARAHLDREARSRAEEYVTTSELSSWRGRAWSHETHDNDRTHLGREARFGADEHVTVPELNSIRRRCLESQDT
jgi:hypothetical protein